MVEHVLRTLEGVVASVSISVSDGTSCPAHLRHLSQEDALPGTGPMGGIYTGLLRMESDWLVTIAGDMPYLTSRSIDRLCSAIDSDSRAVVAVDAAGRLHPLTAAYHHENLEVAEACLRSRDHAVMHFISKIENVRYVTLPDEELRNVNRPEDLLR